jgi:hypothetical protein
MRRRWLFLFAVVVLAVLGAGWLLIPFESPRISQANSDKIQLGWSEEQVSELLGPYTFFCTLDTLGTIGAAATSSTTHWRDVDGNSIEVLWVESRGESRGVTGKTFTPSELSFLQKMKQRVERRFRPLWP